MTLTLIVITAVYVGCLVLACKEEIEKRIRQDLLYEIQNFK